MASQNNIERAIAEFMIEHPTFFPPESSQHPVVLALTKEMYPALVDKFGGVAGFWEEMLVGAKQWFDPKSSSREFIYFRNMIENDGALMDPNEYMKKYAGVYRDYRVWAGKKES